jgi:hypothetical protein
MLHKKKRCTECLKKFRPDPRVGARQKACGDPCCQRTRRQKTQAIWRARNPSYQTAYRLEQRAAAAAAAQHGDEGDDEGSSPPAPLPPPRALTTFPWDLAETAFGFLGADLLVILALRMVRLTKPRKTSK